MNKNKCQHKDYRFKVANREALIGIGLVLFNFIWWFAFAYGLGSKDVSEYTYIIGLPAWFFYSCVLGVIVMSVLVFAIVKSFFVHVNFNHEELEDK
ncbi:YhdT family protein [Gracilibacillus sp. YIM 98692]|uniref:YhdT family protein n=1 Tax=Gracilibacillus sp. YIM 98692 TaxID=2663532 RepID=UPI0013D69F0C|nr:YhdT family protein [Gracilibacillus sp. YIM 98692]